jgi:dipeptidyl aminopeptidase/acylaminoacyl peptidase
MTLKSMVAAASVAVFSGLGGAYAQSLSDYAQLPSISNPEISPDGRWLAAQCFPEQTLSVCVFDLSAGALSQILPVRGDAWINDAFFPAENYLVVNVSVYEQIATVDGMRDYEISRLISLNMETGDSSILLRNERGRVTNATNIASLNLSDPETVLMEMTIFNRAEAQIGTRFQTREGFESGLYRVKLSDGSARLLDQSNLYDRVIDAEGEVLAEITFEADDNEYEIRLTQRGRPSIYSAVHQSNAPSILGFIDETGWLAFFPDRQGGYRRLDIETGEISRLQGLDLNIVSGPIFDRRKYLLGFDGERDGLSAQTFFDDQMIADVAALEEVIGQNVLIASFSSDRNLVIVATEEPGRPAEYYLYNRSAGSLSMINAAYPSLQGVALPERHIYRYEASDGLEIEGVLTVPVGWTPDSASLPLVVLPHGGPAARDSVQFDWWAQAYAQQGYLVLQPNFRGSVGYGVDFRQAGYGEFGDRMVEDILDGARALQEHGFAHEGRYCVAGASYGGYAALRAAIMAPDEVACVVSFAPVTNPVSLLGEQRRYGTFIAYDFWEQYMGDIAFDREQARRISVVNDASRLTMPVLVMHGTEDSVVPIEASEALARSMSADQPFDYVELEGETHFLRLASSRQVLLERSLALFEQTLR